MSVLECGEGGSACFSCSVSQASSRQAHMQLMSRPCNDNVNECRSMYVRCFVTTVCTNCTCMATIHAQTVTQSRSVCEHTASDAPHLTMCHLVMLITIRSTVGFAFCMHTHPAPCPDRVTVRASASHPRTSHGSLVSHPRTPAPRVTGPCLGTSFCGSVSAKRLDELDSNGVDVIVIGSGIGGLTCAAALAKVRVLHALSEHAVVFVSETPPLGCHFSFANAMLCNAH